MKEKINPILKKKKIFCEKDTAYKEDLFQYTSYRNKKKTSKYTMIDIKTDFCFSILIATFCRWRILRVFSIRS